MSTSVNTLMNTSYIVKQQLQNHCDDALTCNEVSGISNEVSEDELKHNFHQQ